MSNYPEFNFPAFDKAAELGRSLGYRVINPADIDRKNCTVDCNSKSFKLGKINGNETDKKKLLKTCAVRDTDAIFKCTHVAILPNWQWSIGGTAEVALARWLKLKFLDALTFKRTDIEPHFAKLRNE